MNVFFSWQAQYLVMLECDFSWQAQQLLKFWEIAGVQTGLFLNKMRLQSAKSKLGERTGCGCSFHVQMIFGSYSDHSLIGFVRLGQFTDLRAQS